MSIARERRRTIGEIAFNAALSASIKAVAVTIDTVRFVRKMRWRHRAHRKR